MGKEYSEGNKVFKVEDAVLTFNGENVYLEGKIVSSENNEDNNSSNNKTAGLLNSDLNVFSSKIFNAFMDTGKEIFYDTKSFLTNVFYDVQEHVEDYADNLEDSIDYFATMIREQMGENNNSVEEDNEVEDINDEDNEIKDVKHISIKPGNIIDFNLKSSPDKIVRMTVTKIIDNYIMGNEDGKEYFFDINDLVEVKIVL